MGMNSGIHDGLNLAAKLLAIWRGETGLNPLQFIPTSPVVDHKRIMLMEDLEDSLQAIPGGPPEIGPPSPEDG